jgi:hypothetical protein
MKTYKFNPNSMSFRPDNERRNIICLIIAALIVLLLVLCYKTDEGKEMYIEGEKVSHNAQNGIDTILSDSTFLHYRSSYGFYIQVKAFEKQFLLDSAKHSK